MYGYLVANTSLLSEKQLARYKAVYCGLCRTLCQRHGVGAGLTLNYDMTFLVLLLNSLYEPEETSGEGRCVRHPKTPHQWQCSAISDYAADLNVLLAYLKCRDNWKDDGNVFALAASGVLKKSGAELSEHYPRQYEAILTSMQRLWTLEKDGIEDADAAAASFGELMAEAFVLYEDRWSGELRKMGTALGKFIYIMDAAMDLDRDTAGGKYNPFRKYYGLDNEQRFRDILKMLLADCIYSFDKLPLVQDVEILQNILCFGLWQQFNTKYSKKEDPSDV